jgi:hypothetical protein
MHRFAEPILAQEHAEPAIAKQKINDKGRIALPKKRNYPSPGIADLLLA